MGVTRSEFEAVFPEIEAILTAHCKQYNIPDQALTWFQKSLPYNTLGGKYNRGLSVPDTAALLLGRQLSPEEHKLTCILGWLTELLQAFFLVSDDIMDASITRRGQPCWYKAPGVGMVAINDAFMLESGIYIILKTLFRSHPRYVDFVELFHEVTFKTEVGQLCDLLTAPEDDVDLSKFSMDKFRFIVIYKTAYYSFYLPVALALLFIDTTPASTGVASPENLKQCEDILIPLGEYFQAQDDYLDAYGAPEVIGKIGTDIMDNKCSWLVNTALAKADASQRQILEDNYGIKDSAKEKKVKELYKEMNLQGVYSEYEEEKVKYIRSLIDKVDESHGLQKSVFETFLGRIYKRSK